MRSRSLDSFEVEDTLATMSIIVDSREQETARAKKRYAAFDAPYSRAVLDYGDYAANCILPDGKRLYDENKRIQADVVIERKMNLDELAGCFTRGRDRFRREFERAKSHNAKIYLLIENASWEMLLAGRYRSKLSPKAFKASLVAYMARYNAQVVMCRAETSGKLIKEILFRELKERLSSND